MKTLKSTLNLFIASICLGSLLLSFASAYAGNLDMNDEQNAKVSRFKAQERINRNDSLIDDTSEEEDFTDFEEDKCGVVDIGNVTDSNPFGAPPKVDVIITGDIINTGNNCN